MFSKKSVIHIGMTHMIQQSRLNFSLFIDNKNKLTYVIRRINQIQNNLE